MTEREVADLLKVVRKSERKLQRRGFFRTKPAAERTVPAAEQASQSKRDGMRRGPTANSSKKPPPPISSAPPASSAPAALPPPAPAPHSGAREGQSLTQALANAVGEFDQRSATHTSPQFRSAAMRTRRRGAQSSGQPLGAGENGAAPPPHAAELGPVAGGPVQSAPPLKSPLLPRNSGPVDGGALAPPAIATHSTRQQPMVGSMVAAHPRTAPVTDMSNRNLLRLFPIFRSCRQVLLPA